MKPDCITLTIIGLLAIAISLGVCEEDETNELDKIACVFKLKENGADFFAGVKKVLLEACKSTATTPRDSCESFENGMQDELFKIAKKNLEGCGTSEEEMATMLQGNNGEGASKEFISEDLKKEFPCIKTLEENCPKEPNNCCDYLNSGWKCFRTICDVKKKEEKGTKQAVMWEMASELLNKSHTVAPDCTI